MDLVALALVTTLALKCSALEPEAEAELKLLVLTPEPQPQLPHSFQPSFSEGPALYLAAQLAADLVNSHNSSILRGYRIELQRGDSGCNVPFRAIEGFVEPLLSSIEFAGAPVVGVVGPACSKSSLHVSTLSSRTELALLNIHLSGTHRLNDRNLYPYSFGILDSSELIATAMHSLTKTAKWSRYALFYDTSRTFYFSVMSAFRMRVGEESEHPLVGVSSTNLSPVHQIRNQFRIVFLLMNTDLLSRFLCMAFHDKYSPTIYQYVLSVDSLSGIDPVDFESDSYRYNCTRNEMVQMLEGAILIINQLERPDSEFVTSSGLSVQSFKELYQEKLDEEGLERSIYAMGFFDSAWSFLMALNASMDSTNLSQYRFGQQEVTTLIRRNLLDLDFEGLTGKIRFNKTTGRVHQNASLFLIDKTGKAINRGYYDRDKDQIKFQESYINDTFEIDIFTVPDAMLWTVSALVLLVLLLMLLMNGLTCCYRNSYSVKASSIRLSQVAFIGCYINAFTMLFTVLIYGYGNKINQGTVCKIQHLLDLSISVQLTVLFGAICVRMWRLYRIFIRFQNPGKCLSDYFLTAVVGIMVVINVIIVVPSFFVDRYEPTLYPLPATSGNMSHIIPSILRCERRQGTLWFISGLLVSAILLSVIFALAVLIRKVPLKNFKPISIIHMSYTLSGLIPLILGVYFLLSNLPDGQVSVILRFSTVCMLILVLIIVPCVMLFLPPLLPVLKEVKNKYFCVKVGHCKPP